MEFSHIPVMLTEAVDGLNIKENGIYVDGTAGGGGHSAEILSRLKTGRLTALFVTASPSSVWLAT